MSCRNSKIHSKFSRRRQKTFLQRRNTPIHHAHHGPRLLDVQKVLQFSADLFDLEKLGRKVEYFMNGQQMRKSTTSGNDFGFNVTTLLQNFLKSTTSGNGLNSFEKVCVCD